jgi:hypothetical protein
MKRVQSSQTPSIHTATPSIFIINSSLGNKFEDPKQDKSNDSNYPFDFAEIIYFTGFNFFGNELNKLPKK